MNDTPEYPQSEKHGNVFGKPVKTLVGRLAFASLAKPSGKLNPNQPKYQCNILFEKSDPDLEKGFKQIAKQIQAMYPIHQAWAVRKKCTKDCTYRYEMLRDGDEKEYNGFAGKWYIAAKSENKPQVYDQEGQLMDPGQLVNGMLVRAAVTPCFCSSGVYYQLIGLQLVEDDGVRFFAGPDAKNILFKDDEESEEVDPPFEGGEEAAEEQSEEETEEQAEEAEAEPEAEEPAPKAAAPKVAAKPAVKPAVKPAATKPAAGGGAAAAKKPSFSIPLAAKKPAAAAPATKGGAGKNAAVNLL